MYDLRLVFNITLQIFNLILNDSTLNEYIIYINITDIVCIERRC